MGSFEATPYWLRAVGRAFTWFPPMARHAYIDTNPRLITVDVARRLLPGTCEHAVHHLLDHKIDLSGVDARFRDDTTGAPAYPPALLLTVVLLADARGSISRRAIEAAPLTAVAHRWRSGATEPDARVPVTVNDANHVAISAKASSTASRNP